MTDAVVRAVCIAGAVVLAAAPYWPLVIAAAAKAIAAVRGNYGIIGKWAAIGLLVIAATWGKVPVPTFNVPAATVTVDTPSDAMQRVVTPIAEALKAAPMGDRMLWAQVWSKAAIVVDGDAISTEVVFTDTKSLRAFTVLALDIGWRRLGGNQPGKYAGLRDATEAAFAEVIGKAEVPVTKDLRQRYAELCRAIAWAGVNAG